LLLLGLGSDACHRLFAAALLGRFIHTGQVMRAVHQGDMRKSLRKIPDQAAPRNVVFFREQADIVAKIDELVEQSLRVGIPPDQVIGGRPSSVAPVS
jgi:hypothetical protein